MKRRLEDVLQELLTSILDRRAQVAQDRGRVLDLLRADTDKARAVTQATLSCAIAWGYFRLGGEGARRYCA